MDAQNLGENVFIPMSHSSLCLCLKQQPVNAFDHMCRLAFRVDFFNFIDLCVHIYVAYPDMQCDLPIWGAWGTVSM